MDQERSHSQKVQIKSWDVSRILVMSQVHAVEYIERKLIQACRLHDFRTKPLLSRQLNRQNSKLQLVQIDVIRGSQRNSGSHWCHLKSTRCSAQSSSSGKRMFNAADTVQLNHQHVGLHPANPWLIPVHAIAGRSAAKEPIEARVLSSFLNLTSVPYR